MSNPLPIFNGGTRPTVTSCDNWRRAALKGSGFDPQVDRFLDKSVFPSPQPIAFGNVTRLNPKVRSFPVFNENISMGKSFPLFSESGRLDFRWEARQMQIALKLYW